jgi:hypothetical protein
VLWACEVVVEVSQQVWRKILQKRLTGGGNGGSCGSRKES